MCVHSFLLFCIFTPLSLQRANAMQRVIFNFDFTCLCCFCCHRRFLCCSSNYLYANKLFIPTFWWTGYNVLDHHHKHQGLWRSWQEYKDCRVDFDDSRAFSKKQEYKWRLRSTRSTRISCSCGLTWSTHGVSDSEVRISQLKREINFNYNFKWMFQTTVVSDPIWESFKYEWRYNWRPESMQCTFIQT